MTPNHALHPTAAKSAAAGELGAVSSRTVATKASL